jgi:hypothetical protein
MIITFVVGLMFEMTAGVLIGIIISQCLDLRSSVLNELDYTLYKSDCPTSIRFILVKV